MLNELISPAIRRFCVPDPSASSSPTILRAMAEFSGSHPTKSALLTSSFPGPGIQTSLSEFASRKAWVMVTSAFFSSSSHGRSIDHSGKTSLLTEWTDIGTGLSFRCSSRKKRKSSS
ncbi:unnamed protein product [Prorocentrum cordatum]|uniref:Uncharacterized protein n=1 Tax=Prorocentrum cordatum TaxID=2364126 RepID=A0ABN9XF99_9DINO|nr:unnamed protein product [Polarella glacialis]